MLTERQSEIVTGSLLGDGTIWTDFNKNHNMRLAVCQSENDHEGVDKKSYMEWFAKEFSDLGCKITWSSQKVTGLVKTICGDVEKQKYEFRTRNNILWNQWESKWYVPREDHRHFRRRKVIPRDLRLTPLTLCVWHMDDGSVCAKDANLQLHTEGFTKEEVAFLIEKLDKDLSIKSSVKDACRNGQEKVYVGRKSYFDFIEIIRPHVEWNCFAYKLDTHTYSKVPHRGEGHSRSKLKEDDIHEIFRLRETGLMHKEIAVKFGVSSPTICLVLNGKLWGHIKRKPAVIVQDVVAMIDP